MENIIKLVERRAKRQLSKAKLAKDCSILVLQDESCSSAVNTYLIKKFVNITKNVRFAKNLPAGHSFDIVSLPNTADTEAAELLDHLLANKPFSSQQKNIKLLRDSLESEVIFYAKAKSLKFKSTPASDIVRKFEGVNKGSVQSLAKSREFLENS